jgi:hypothetical protein
MTKRARGVKGWVWRPGVWFARLMRQALPDGAMEVLEVASPLSLGTAGALASIHRSERWPIPILAAALIVQASTSYLSKAKAKLEKSEAAEAVDDATEVARNAEARAAEELRRWKRDFAGNLSHLLKMCVVKDHNQLRNVQSGFLRHAVDVMKRHLGLPEADQRLSASWVTPTHQREKFKTIAYDRNHPNRSPGTTRPIKPGIPGAPHAFLTGSVGFIHDTHHDDLSAFFPKPPVYRTILAVPAAVLNIPDGSGYVPVQVEGVLNLDSTETDLLREEHAALVHDIAYLLALCERVMAKRGAK